MTCFLLSLWATRSSRGPQPVGKSATVNKFTGRWNSRWSIAPSILDLGVASPAFVVHCDRREIKYCKNRVTLSRSLLIRDQKKDGIKRKIKLKKPRSILNKTLLETLSFSFRCAPCFLTDCSEDWFHAPYKGRGNRNWEPEFCILSWVAWAWYTRRQI